MKLLNNCIRDKVAKHWYDFGIQLLDNECIEQLDIIEMNYCGDAQRCCTEMFKYWLQIDPEATWNKLADASENIGLKVLAKKIKESVKGSYVTVIINFSYIHIFVQKHGSDRFR